MSIGTFTNQDGSSVYPIYTKMTSISSDMSSTIELRNFFGAHIGELPISIQPDARKRYDFEISGNGKGLVEYILASVGSSWQLHVSFPYWGPITFMSIIPSSVRWSNRNTLYTITFSMIGV